jgi:hypothetical protein
MFIVFMVRGKSGNKHTIAIFFSLSSGVMKETLRRNDWRRKKMNMTWNNYSKILQQVLTTHSRLC